MRRTPLARRSPLARKPLAARRPRLTLPSEAERVWKLPQAGFCECGCSRPSWHLARHHVVYRQHVHKEGGDEWALLNSLLLHEDCHAAQHSGYRRIPLSRLSDEAIDFAHRLLKDAAPGYLRRYYHDDGDPRIVAMEGA